MQIQEIVTPLRKIATNARQSKMTRGETIKSLISVRTHGEITRLIFDVLVEVVKNDADDVVRFQAAQGFVIMARGPKPPEEPEGSYTVAQLEVLRGLLKAEKNDEIAKCLRAAIDKVK